MEIKVSIPIAYHGIAAFRGGRGWRELLAKGLAAASLDSGAEICVADRAIGPIGLVVGGAISAVYDSDCWSELDHEGRRVSNHTPMLRAERWSRVAGMMVPSPISHDQWITAAHGVYARNIGPFGYVGGRSYCEAFMDVRHVHAVWVKEYADVATRKVARVLARKLGVSVRVIESAQRVWDLYGGAEEARIRQEIEAIAACTNPRWEIEEAGIPWSLAAVETWRAIVVAARATLTRMQTLDTLEASCEY